MIDIDGFKASVSFDAQTRLFRGALVGRQGTADFYAPDIASLVQQGRISLRVLVDMCREDGIVLAAE